MRYLGKCNSCNTSLTNRIKTSSNKCKCCTRWNFLSLNIHNQHIDYSELIDFLNNIRFRAKNIMHSYRATDIKKGRDFDLTVRWIEKELIKGCFYCSYPATGLDRKDNYLGHIKSNCVACCHECNIIRMDKMSHQDIIFLGKHIKEMKDLRGLDTINNFNKIKEMLNNKPVHNKFLKEEKNT